MLQKLYAETHSRVEHLMLNLRTSFSAGCGLRVTVVVADNAELNVLPSLASNFSATSVVISFRITVTVPHFCCSFCSLLVLAI